MAGKINKAREALADMFVKCLEQDTLPWNQPWVNNIPSFGAHNNPITGTRYHGMNAVILWATALVNNYPDSRWVTYKQAAEKGWQVKRGSHGARVEYWYLFDTAEKKKISWAEAQRVIDEKPEREADFKMCSNVYTVFNGSQIAGIPELPVQAIVSQPFQNNLLQKFAENYLAAENIPLLEGNYAAYSPRNDNITMPPKESFVSEIAYYDTLFHECAHSTGVEKRLNRGLETKNSKEEYAIEELRAEMAGAFILSETGAPVPESVSENNRAYIQGWAEDIKKDPAVLFQAIKSANEISDYIENKGELELLLAQEQELSLEELAVQMYDLECEYDPQGMMGYDREEQIFLSIDLLEKGDTEDFASMLREIQTYGGTEEMISKAGLLLEKLEGFEPELSKDEEEIEL